mmetsp:Transcript_44369/g.105062  ORF Transcript_44369/g.105062 Transcript_44369/m.105062 type:complete len:218 (+) Transcript_44369:516-1169(+)
MSDVGRLHSIVLGILEHLVERLVGDGIISCSTSQQHWPHDGHHVLDRADAPRGDVSVLPARVGSILRVPIFDEVDARLRQAVHGWTAEGNGIDVVPGVADALQDLVRLAEACPQVRGGAQHQLGLLAAGLEPVMQHLIRLLVGVVPIHVHSEGHVLHALVQGGLRSIGVEDGGVDLCGALGVLLQALCDRGRCLSCAFALLGSDDLQRRRCACEERV